MTQPDKVSDDKPSKSARKREYTALQALGESLIGLDADVLDALPIDEDARDAIVAAKSMRSRSALRRQKQLIGKRMVGTDVEALQSALDELRRGESEDKRLFASAERWRDRILEEGFAAVDAFSDLAGDETADALRQSYRNWSGSVSDRDRKRWRRTIFRQVHEGLLACGADGRLPR